MLRYGEGKFVTGVINVSRFFGLVLTLRVLYRAGRSFVTHWYGSKMTPTQYWQG